jgi:hypothetical protein
LLKRNRSKRIASMQRNEERIHDVVEDQRIGHSAPADKGINVKQSLASYIAWRVDRSNMSAVTENSVRCLGGCA